MPKYEIIGLFVTKQTIMIVRECEDNEALHSADNL